MAETFRRLRHTDGFTVGDPRVKPIEQELAGRLSAESILSTIGAEVGEQVPGAVGAALRDDETIGQVITEAVGPAVDAEVQSKNLVTEQRASDVATTAAALSLTRPGIKAPKPILVFVDDDGRKATFNVTREIFNAKGKKFVAAVTTTPLGTGDYMSLAQVQQLQAEGHEISSHHVTHQGITDLTQLGESQRWLRERGIDAPTLTWVGGAFNDAAINEAKKFYTCALSVVRGMNVPPVNQFTLRRYAVGSMWQGTVQRGILEDGSQAQYNAMVDMAKNNNALVIAMMHNWEPQFDATQRSRVEAMIDYADTQGVEIMTLSQAVAHFGNAVDIGIESSKVFRVGADGSVQSTDLDTAYRRIPPTGITAATPGPNFPAGTVTATTLTVSSASGFPVSDAGTLQTYHLDDQSTIRQVWMPFGTNTAARTTWERNWNYTTNVWSAWRGVVHSPVRTASITVPPQTVEPGQVVQVSTPHPEASAFTSADNVLASPSGGLETGLIHTVTMTSARNVVIRLYNPTTTAITTLSRVWQVRVLAN